MSNNDYWNEKENEKYQKMKVGIEYNDLDFTKVKKFSGELNKIVKVASIIAIIIGILTIIFVIMFLIIQWKGINQLLNQNS